MAILTKIGFGQVEPNHLSAQRNAQIYAQLPAAEAALRSGVIENGMFLKYDIVAGEMNTTGLGEDMLVFSEVKLYDRFREVGYKNFALKKAEAVGGKVYPRLFKTAVGDIFTTNLAMLLTGTVSASFGKLFVITAGVLTEVASATPSAGVQTWIAAKITTMPDGQAAIKFQRIQ